MSKSGVIGDDECIRCRPTKDSGRSRGQPIFQEDPDVLIQHLDPSHHSLLAEILSKATKLPVGEVKSGIRIKPNHVYVIPPDAFMAITAATFKLTPRNKGSGQHLSVNFFMRSLAEERMSGAIGVILSGTGADATLGLERIKVEGGITFAQDPQRPSTMACHAAPSIPGVWTSFCLPKRSRRSCKGFNDIRIYARRNEVQKSNAKNWKIPWPLLRKRRLSQPSSTSCERRAGS
jgi:hypothetical protein